ncbi:MAG: hypothetical protein GXO68_04735 [Crenarchaeota archaeon]|nr:hypothetical protein [Thermoproteota archaeon]
MQGASDSQHYMVLGVPVYIRFLSYKGSPEDVAKAYQGLPEECRDRTIIAALPGEPVTLCEAVTSFIHALDSRFRGSRVRSLSILFIMELLGYRQVRDVVDNVKSADYLIAASTENSCFEEAVRLVSSLEGVGDPIRVEECDFEGLSRRVVSSVRRGIRLE